MVHSFRCFSCSWISFLCFYLDNNCITWFLIACSAKSLLRFTFLIFRSIKTKTFLFCCHYDIFNVGSHYYFGDFIVPSNSFFLLRFTSSSFSSAEIGGKSSSSWSSSPSKYKPRVKFWVYWKPPSFFSEPLKVYCIELHIYLEA